MKRFISLLICVLMVMSFTVSSLAISSVPVKEIKVTNVGDDALVLLELETYKLTVAFSPDNTTQKMLNFSTADRNVAVVDKLGTIKGIKEGKTVITVASVSDKKLSIKCNVVVNKRVPTKISIKVSHGNAPYIASSKNINENKYVVKINELANVKLDISLIDHNKYNDIVNLMYASGDLPDVFISQGMTPVTENAIKQGVWLNLKPYINEKTTPNLLSVIPPLTWKFSDVLLNGQQYYIPRFTSLKTNLSTYIRSDLLSKYNLKVPDTIEDYLNVMRTFKKNGVKYPTSGRENFAYLSNFFGAYGVNPIDYIFDKDGKIVPAAITPNMKKALALFRQMYEEGLLDPEFLSNTGTAWINKINAGDVGMFVHQVASMAMWSGWITPNVPTAKFIMMPGPKGPNGFRGSWSVSSGVTGCILINKSVKEPEKIVKFFDWMATNQAQQLLQLGIEFETYKKADGKLTFTYPKQTYEQNELMGRSTILNFMGDPNKLDYLAPFAPYGKETAEYVKKYGRTEGIPNVLLLGPAPAIYSQRPEIQCGNLKDSLWLEMASKIVYGKEPIDYFDKWVIDWKARGGDTLLQQLEEKRKDGQYIEMK